MPQTLTRCFTSKYDSISRVLSNTVHIGLPFDPTIAPKDMEHKPFVAIWDTGATNTVISNAVAQACGLKSTGFQKVHTASGTDIVSTYLVSVGLPNKIIIPSLNVTEGKLTGTDLLIGMDIISLGDFAVTSHNGKTVFSFRMPSTECIDFINNGQPVTNNTITSGRNDPCPCGSDKKYKKCHGKDLPA